MDDEIPFLPYGRQHIDEDDIQAVVDVLRSPFLTSGPAVEAFELALQSQMAVPNAVACMNGTAALHLSAMAFDIGPGDVVIVPAITFLATANGPALNGADVVFADVDAETGLMMSCHVEEALLRANIKGRTRAIYPVHLNGQCADMANIQRIAKDNNLKIIEDACHALGGQIIGPDGNDWPVGACAWSDMSTFSFHPVKTIAMGEGGAVTCRDKEIGGRLRILRNHGMTRDPSLFTQANAAHDSSGNVNAWYYEMLCLGNNYRAPDINCALGRSQLEKLKGFVEKRRWLTSLYDARFDALAPVVKPLPHAPNQSPARHLYVALVDFKMAGYTRGYVMDQLYQRGIGTQVHNIPVSDQPYWRQKVDTPSLPGAQSYYEKALSLPLFTTMTEDDVERVVTALIDILGLQ